METDHAKNQIKKAKNKICFEVHWDQHNEPRFKEKLLAQIEYCLLIVLVIHTGLIEWSHSHLKKDQSMNCD